jgi:hypothetical protein
LTEPVLSQDVAAALVISLRSVVPDRSEVHLSAEGGTVRIVDSWASPVLVDLSTFGVGGRLTTAQAVTAVAALLSTVQDLVCEALTEPWPQTEAGGLALPEAGVEGGWIVARFNDAGIAMPVLPVG